MSIEDVQLINDNDLADKLAELMGWKLEEHLEVNGRGQWMDEYEFGVFYKQDGSYQERLEWEPCDNWEQAREAQAKAMEVSADRYVSNLDYVVNPDSTIDVWTNDAIVKLLQATPRQIAEAAYLTLKG